MLIAHLPAGYLLSRCVSALGVRFGVLTTVALLGSVLPDVDLVYFYTLGGRAHHHHTYITHTPFFWVLVSASLALVGRTRLWRLSAAMLALACVGHLGLDSIAGQIRWLWPLSGHGTTLVSIPAVYSWWLLSFVFHWTFALEVCLWLAAFWLWHRDSRSAA